MEFALARLHPWWRAYGGIVLILWLGAVLRLYQFPHNPPGFYVDEAGVSYEAFSLLHTGADRWGIRWPVYLISWGSGQSVLYAYLSIPFIALFGLNILASRLLNLFLGILTIPLTYVTVKRVSGEKSALVVALLLAVLPWHVMLSRWALEANALPFFLLLGTYTIARLLAQPKRFWAFLAFVPWGLALYAYAMAWIVVPLMLVLVVITNYVRIKPYWREWLKAFMVFAGLALPIGLFVLKNFIVRTHLPWEDYMPFGVPLVPFSRIAQVTSQPPFERWIHSFFVIWNGFQDGEIKNSLPEIAPMFFVCLPLAFVGTVHKIRYAPSRGHLFLLWLLACVPLLFPWDLANHRVNAFLMPLLVIAVEGFFALGRCLCNSSRRMFTVAVGFLIALQAILFTYDYFFIYPRLPDAELAFYKGFERAFKTSLTLAEPSEAIWVTNRILLPYFLVAFYSAYPPAAYRADIRYTLEYGTVNVQSLGRFYFGKENLLTDPSFVYVLAKWDELPCREPQFALETRLWQVGRCVYSR